MRFMADLDLPNRLDWTPSWAFVSGLMRRDFEQLALAAKLHQRSGKRISIRAQEKQL